MKKTTIERRKELLERKVGLKQIGINRKEGEARWVKNNQDMEKHIRFSQNKPYHSVLLAFSNQAFPT